MTNHTPGPWTFNPAGGYVTADTLAHGTVRIADIPDCRDIPYPSEAVLSAIREQAANARLIAAAPEMLALLIKAEGFISGFEGDDTQDESVDPMLNRIRAAIAKAKGTDP